MFLLELFQNLWEFALENDGVAIPIATAILGGLGWLGKRLWKRFERRKRRRSLAAVDTFPFKVIAPQSKDVVQQVYGSAQQTKDDPLADFNIPYQRRVADVDMQAALRARLMAKGWLLILGRTGLGKTREAAELAQRHSDEGWTVLRLANEQLLTVPDSFPVDRLGERPKLLFVLDDLNRAMFLSGRLRPKNEDGQKSAPMSAPLQERLLETVRFYSNACGVNRVLVVATARNEKAQEQGLPSEWEKLGVDEYPAFWNCFEFCELVPPEDTAVSEMLAAAARKAEIEVKADLLEIARANDQTFRNPVENLEALKSRGESLRKETFQETIGGNWALRYRRMREQYGERAVWLYDSVDLLRQADMRLREERVLAVGAMRGGIEAPWQVLQRRKLRGVLQEIRRTERLLEPRDGQIEAKGYAVDLEDCFEALCGKLVPMLPVESSVGDLVGLAVTANRLRLYEIALALLEKCLRSSLDRGRDFLLFEKGFALDELGRYEEAITAYDAAVAIKPDDHEALNNKGYALGKLGRYKDAIAAYDAAVAIKPDKHEALDNKGYVLSKMGRIESAIATYNTALEIAPNYANAWYNKACAYASLRKAEDALTNLTKAIELEGTNEYVEMAKTDTDLDSIRSDPKFQSWLVAQ